jgi:transcriptional regulator with XRE-family HTH domain
VNRKTTDIDLFVGIRLRQARIARGFSQERLDGLVGVTFQQIQKYEKGSGRISAARLQQMTEGLGVSVNDLLDERDLGNTPPIQVESDAWKLIRRFERLDAPMRARVVRIVEACAEED